MGAAGGAAVAVLAACGGTDGVATIAPPTQATGNSVASPPATTAPATTGAPTVAAATTPRTATPKGELRYSLGVHFPVTLDPTKDGLPLTFNGPAESLTRLTPTGMVEPYLAEGVTNVDATTWRVALRKNAKFHDGSPVDADAVIASFRRSWELQPAANLQLSKETQLTARDATTVEFRTPRPTEDFPNALASQYLAIHKQTASGIAMTGAYRPTKLVVDQELVMEAFLDWR